ncbi:efflux RND transporter periplasmic adaptor subunit [Dyella sp. BiH032]|uniref:efflux RND transporter periplasmic adaptor subunit n=1 Tax=Dyella sp. BiH032 TaxID=3075430 RepID=UPI00289299B2|nr:efflux RND transporter periplasmic adaptor subunit [Dyella sp. BiH032]WNL44646.1 efflux RND transporter periplasmic adaptor subunit [Dyella sp. BiH032]
MSLPSSLHGGALFGLCLLLAFPAAASSARLSADQVKLLGIATARAERAATVPVSRLPAEIVMPLDGVRTVSVPFAGTVLAVRVDDGATVKAGQVLASLQSRDFLAAQAELRRAQIDASLAQRQSARDASLLAEGIIARTRAEESRARADDASARLVQFRDSMGDAAAAQGAPGEYVLRAPQDGRVLRRMLAPGQGANALDSAFVIARDGGMDVQFQVPATLRAALRPGLGVAMEDGTRGEVTAVSAMADAGSQSLRLRARLAPDAVWAIGQRTSLRLDIPAPADAVAVPASAVLPDGEHAMLLTVQGDRYTAVRVERLGADGERAVVRGAVPAGATVVTRGASALKPLLGE